MSTPIKLLVTAVIVGGLAFFGGMKYGSAHAAANVSGNFRFMRTGGGNVGTANFSAGQVIVKDAQSVTIKTRDGSTHIVVFGNAEVMKYAPGTTSDLQIGQTISVQGTPNQDGSLTATSIQIRPAMPSPSPSAQ